jgi:hypothetical protein
MTNSDNQVKRARGGRGIKAQHPTTTVRVPYVLKESIQDIVFRFYQHENENSDTSLNDSENDSSKKLLEISEYLSTFTDNNKVTKSKVKLYELITGLQAILNAD